ncbi:hypothetical protein BDB00DRAFT_870717 [Zychaea mexicana]|uniref:uncharacterized protein n=1 Tax=Zychaea mexicana TaxID=64656 RepID=UPI0022FEF54B|nr:uncharacterized protein BDB00DRAFT_870717 [Zychaea mexicana]KAI9495272.1 hypothetical protein BDB00DRAFT_870717 [Zychaea mexicana]
MTREVTRIDLSNNTELLPNDLLQRLPACTTPLARKLGHHSSSNNNNSNDSSSNQHVTQLLLRRNGFEDLKNYSKALHCMRHHLHELSLRENNFSYIPFEILCLTQLTSLSLASNRIQDIPEGTLCSLSNLQWLSLSNNYLIQLPNDLAKCHRLKGLDIHSNEFSSIPPVIFELKNLEVLLIQRNRINQIPSAFPNRVHTLNLGFNALDHVPQTLVDALPTNLSHLYLSGNPLQTLPKDFLLQPTQHQQQKQSSNTKTQQQQRQLQLTSLDLHTCGLTEIAPSFFTYPAVRRLQRLNLAINQLSAIPDTLGLLTELEWLNLNDNRLSTLPASMGELTKLVKLGLVQNQLKCLPPRLFSRMQCLQKVDIRRNKLAYFPASVLALAPLTEAIAVEEVGVPLAVFHVVVPSPGGAAQSYCPPSCPVWSSRHQRTTTNENNDGDKSRSSSNSEGGGGALRTMLFYENPSMDHSTGILYSNKTILTLDYADTLLEQGADLHTSLDWPQTTTTCMTSKTEVARELPSCTITTDDDSSSSAVSSQVLSLREIAVRILLATHNKPPSPFSGPPTAVFCFEHMTEKHSTPRLIDAFPKERQAFLDKVASPNLVPEHIRQYIRQDSMRQCDHCGKWFSDSPFEIGYMARMCMERVRVPIRFSICSRACALNAVVQLHTASKGWRTVALPVQQLEHEDMAIEDTQAPALQEEVQLHVTNRVTGWKQLVRQGFYRLFKPFQRYSHHHYQQQQQQQQHHQYNNDSVDPPALITVTRQPIHTSNPRTTAFNHLPRDAIRLERF